MKKLNLVLVTVLGASVAAGSQFKEDFTGEPDGALTEWTEHLAQAQIEGERLCLRRVAAHEIWAWAGQGGKPLYFNGVDRVEFTIEFGARPDAANPAGVGRHGGVMVCASAPTNRYDTANAGYVIDWIDRVETTYNDHGFRVMRVGPDAQGVWAHTILAQRTAALTDPPAKWRIAFTATGFQIFGDDTLITFDDVRDADSTSDTINDATYRGGFLGYWCYYNVDGTDPLISNIMYVDNVTVDMTPGACPVFAVPRLRARFEDPPIPVTLHLPYGANATTPYSFTVSTSNAAVANPVGAAGGQLSIQVVPGAHPTISFDLAIGQVGTADLTLTAGGPCPASVFSVEVVPKPTTRFFEDFAGEPDGTPVDFRVSQGLATIESEQIVLRASGESYAWAALEQAPQMFQDIAKISFKVTFPPDPLGDAVGRHGGVIFCAASATNRGALPNYTFDFIDRDQAFRLFKNNNSAAPLAMVTGVTQPGSAWSIEFASTTMTFFVDGIQIAKVVDPDRRSGYVGFWCYSNAGQEMKIDDVEIMFAPPECAATMTPAGAVVLPGGVPPDFTVRIPFGLNLTADYSVTVTSTAPAVVKPVGSDAQGKLVLTFPRGAALAQTFGTTIGTTGLAQLQLLEPGRGCTPVSATVLVPQTEDSFSDDFARPDGPPGPWSVYAREWAIAGGALSNTRWTGALPEANIWAGSPPLYFDDVESISATVRFGDSLGDGVGRHGGLTLFAGTPTTRWATSGYTVDWIDRVTDQGYRILRFDPRVGAVSLGTVLDQTANARPGEFTEPGTAWKIDIVDDTISLTVDAELLLTVTDSTYPKSGFIGFWTYENGSQIIVDDVVIGAGVQPETVSVFMGNANGDATVNIADAVTILGYLFGKPPKPVIPCFKAADTNDDNTLNVADAVDVLTFLFGAQTNPSKPMTGPDGSAINTAACRPYPAADIPATIIGQPGCATPCK